MNKNQFLYTRRQPKPLKVEGKEQEFDEFQDSFNVNKVIRSVTHTDGTVIVILDDFNERVTQKPDIDPKTNKYKGVKNVREVVQSEIILSKDDGARFFKLTNIEQ
jgi:hypothetical protein